jgi:LacI family transcriptional regulator
MLKNYTIRDIAEMAGVSKGTVDRVIHKRGKVSEHALKKVNEILNKIDFKPNIIAKNLKKNKVYNICVLLPDPKKDPYWDACVTGINDVITDLGVFGVNIETFFFDSTSQKSFLEANLKIQSVVPDAVFLVPLFFKEACIVLENYSALGIPVSTFNNDIASSPVKSFIGQDLYQSGRIAAKLLHSIINDGDVAIIHMNEKYKNAVFMQEKEKGFKSYFNELANCKFNILKCKTKHHNFEITLTNFLKVHPNLTGIFVTTSKAYQVADIIKNKEYNNISIVGYDLIKENVRHLKLGTIDFLIHQNPKQQAYFGLKYIVEHFLFEKEIPQQILLPIDIINSENVTQFIGN